MGFSVRRGSSTRAAGARSLSLFLLALLLCACGAGAGATDAASDAAPSDASAAAQQLPSDVAALLGERCVSCHAETPRYGAPMPLRTWSDLQAPARSDASRRVYELVSSRIADERSPMPPTGVMPSTDRAVLDAWIARGAPACDPSAAGASCASVAGEGGGPSTVTLPCPESEQVRFHAHAEAGPGRYHVARDAGNANICFTFRSPFTSPTQLTASRPDIVDARVVHHWILFETATEQVDGGAGPCRMPADAVFVSGWAPGNPGQILPSDVGLQLPQSDKWFILQVHYWNVAGYDDADDASGITMCATHDLRPKNAAVHMLGSANIVLPARTNGVDVVGRCTPVNGGPVHVLGSSPHMHQLGRSQRTVVLRGGREDAQEMLVDVPNYRFEEQRSYPSELVLQPGDTLRTTCRYDNTSDRRVYFGERTEDEMCFNFVMAWPAGSLSNTPEGRRCIDR